MLHGTALYGVCVGKRAQRRRKDRDLAKHMVERQIEPQLAIDAMRKQGHEVEGVFVNTDPDAEGFTVTCLDCKRTAKMPFDPGVKVAVCPDCAKRRHWM